MHLYTLQTWIVIAVNIMQLILLTLTSSIPININYVNHPNIPRDAINESVNGSNGIIKNYFWHIHIFTVLLKSKFFIPQ